MRWIEVFAEITALPSSESIFKNKKHNLPKEAPSPELAKFLYAVRSMIFGSDLKKVNTNLPPDEEEALKQLVKAQKDGRIVIKRADKGGATVIMNRQDYVESMIEHLESTIVDENGETVLIYQEVDPCMYKRT